MENFVRTSDVVASAMKCKRSLTEAQKNLGCNDFTRNLQMMRDGIVANYFGFDATNNGTTGWDAVNTSDSSNFESKTNSLASKSYQATFQDTTVDKARRFATDNVVVALTVFSSVLTPMFSVIGSNPTISQELEEKSNRKREHGVRPNVVIPMKSLINKYGYKIVALEASKDEVLRHLQSKYKRGFSSLTIDDILTPDEIEFAGVVEE